MIEYLPLALVAVTGLACSLALLASRSPLLLALTALAGTSVGLYLADRLGVPPNAVKIYLSAVYAVAFVLLGRVPRFQVEPWECLLPLFFLGRVLLDFLRPDFELRYPFGGVGDGLFLMSAYFYFKKAFLARPEVVDALLRAVLYCSLAMAVFGVFEALKAIDLFVFTDPRFMIEGRHRANSIFRAPEYFGAAMSLSICVVLLLYSTRRLTGVAALGVGALLLAGTLASLYRGIWLALLAGLVFLFVVRPGQGGLLRIPSRLAATGLIVAVAALSIQALLKNTAMYEERIANTHNVDLRLAVYAAIGRGVADNPLLGHGTGTVEEYLAATPYNPTELTTPHNGYLAIAFENGIAFLAIYLGWFIALLWRVRETSRPTMRIAGAMAAIVLVTNMTMYFPLSFDYHSLLVLMVAALGISERETFVNPGSTAFTDVRDRSVVAR